MPKTKFSVERVVVFELFAYSVSFVVLGLPCGASYPFPAPLGHVLAVFSGGPGPQNRTDATPFLVSAVDTWFTVRFRTPRHLKMPSKNPQNVPKTPPSGPQRGPKGL